MDQLGALIDGPRARSAFLLRTIIDPPWCLRIEDEAPLTVVAVVHGSATVCHDGGEPETLRVGDVAIVRGPRHYVVADDLSTAPQVIIHPGQRCSTVDGVELVEAMSLGVRTWGSSASGSTVLLTGTYESEGAASRRILDAIPDLIVVRHSASSSPIVDLLAAEIVRDAPGQTAVLDRLLDLLLMATLREWFETSATSATWYSANADPVIGPAVRMLQNNPAQPWTVARLAAESGVSRAALARRFHDLVGEPPMAFLANWRLALAADHLLEPGATVTAVSRQVGYTSPFTFSTAFKRAYGVSPNEHRTRHRGPIPAAARRSNV